MLQTVLGLDASRIASAFLVKPSAMGQRLTRVKAKIRDARIAFGVPEAKELPGRLDAVLEAIHATYGTGWNDVAGADARRKGLATEAVTLRHLLLQLLPAEPEVRGLLALMLYCEARRDARLSREGDYVPLSEQDADRWTWPLFGEAHQLLLSAEHAGKIGCFQWWSMLQAIPAESVATYQPYWALAAHLLGPLGRDDEARAAYDRAIGLCEDPVMRAYLVRKPCALECVHTRGYRGLPCASPVRMSNFQSAVEIDPLGQSSS
jgi:RNA polymerase sigma-70 factor (ECF subfamily)